MRTLIGLLIGAVAATLWLTYEPKKRPLVSVKGRGEKARFFVVRPEDEDPKTRTMQ